MPPHFLTRRQFFAASGAVAAASLVMPRAGAISSAAFPKSTRDCIALLRAGALGEVRWIHVNLPPQAGVDPRQWVERFARAVMPVLPPEALEGHLPVSVYTLGARGPNGVPACFCTEMRFACGPGFVVQCAEGGDTKATAMVRGSRGALELRGQEIRLHPEAIGHEAIHHCAGKEPDLPAWYAHALALAERALHA